MQQYAVLFILLQSHSTFFEVLLTVHVSIFILVINQLDAQNLLYNKFISCLYMFRATSLQRGQMWPRWREVAVPILWPVPEAAVTVFSTPDDGCCDTRNM